VSICLGDPKDFVETLNFISRAHDARALDSASSRDPANLLRRVTWPVAALVAMAVAAAWYVTWASSDLTMGVLMAPSMAAPTDLLLVFVLLIVMMVAMMLPSALPMVLTYHELSRLEHGEPTKRPDRVGTTVFASGYFVVWGLFSLGAFLALSALGLLGSLTGFLAVIPAGVLLAAGVWQASRTKEVCLTHCQSPMGFVMQHWRSGRAGAWRMGAYHALFCIGCCWLFMLVLFVSGAMSLVWMGGISVAIFVEKLGWRPILVSRAIGLILVVAGGLVLFQAIPLL
jgi:predicted metal-binding membrane protein